MEILHFIFLGFSFLIKQTKKHTHTHTHTYIHTHTHTHTHKKQKQHRKHLNRVSYYSRSN